MSNFRMVQLRFLAFGVLVSVLPAVAAEPGAWGPTVNGVRMSVAITGNSTDAELHITVDNVSDKLLLLPLGEIIGDRIYWLHFQVFVKTPDGKDLLTSIPGEGGVISGLAFPLLVPLVPNTSYTVQKQIGKSIVLDGSERLQTLTLQHSQLRAELDIPKSDCNLFGYQALSTIPSIPCWQGKLVSNALQLPK